MLCGTVTEEDSCFMFSYLCNKQLLIFLKELLHLKPKNIHKRFRYCVIGNVIQHKLNPMLPCRQISRSVVLLRTNLKTP